MGNAVLIGVLLLPLLMLGVRYWQKALVAALLLVVIEGALRKWIFPGSEQMLYFAKDIFLLSAYIGLLFKHGLRIPRPAGVVALLVTVGALYGAVQMGNPELPAPSLGIVGWKAYFFYAPLIIVVPYALTTDEQTFTFLKKYLFLIGPIALLGIFQFYSSPGSSINTYARGGTGADIAGFGGNVWHVRATGTFSYITGYSTYAMSMAFLSIGLLGVKGWKWNEGKWLYAALAASLVASLTTGSRAPVFSLGLLFPFYILNGFLTGDLAGRRAIRLFFGLLLVVIVVKFGMREAVVAFQHRAAGGGAIERMFSPLVEPFKLLNSIGIFGFGIGSMHQAASAIVGSSTHSWTGGLIVEGESSKVMVELGFIGFVLVYLVRILLLIQAVRFSFRLSTPSGRSLAAAIAMFFAVSLPGAVVFNPTGNVYYWFAAGLLYYLVISDEREGAASAVPAGVTAGAGKGSGPILDKARTVAGMTGI